MVLVYVEGDSDKLAMEEILSPLIEAKYSLDILIRFIPAIQGDKQQDVLIRVPQRAVNILRNNTNTIVIAMPDLSPKDKGFKHETPEQLSAGVVSVFERALKRAGLEDMRIRNRFHVFCFKHDMEALILACENELKLRLKTDKLGVTWRKPVEDQNHGRYPKFVVEELFKHHKQHYQGTVDAPEILGMAGLAHVVDACPQCFKPFVDFLDGLA
jgi:hypothetical protein